MRNRWLTFCQQINAQGNVEQAWTNIEAHYKESHRFYHTLEHIEFCLNQFDQAQQHNLANNPYAVEMAIWLHDVIYDASKIDNEDKSADYSTQLCQQLQLSEQFSELIVANILATKHTNDDLKNDTALIADCDLSSLAIPEVEFKQNTTDIRQEYLHISEEKFYQGVTIHFQKLLTRPSIFLTNFFKAKYEPIARFNLKTFLNKFS